MAFLQFPKDLYILELDPGENQLGSYDWSNIVEIGSGVLWIYKHGSFNITTETAKLKVYSTVGLDNLLFESDLVNLVDISGINDGNWLGKVRFDFNRHPIDGNSEYYVTIEMSNYTYVSTDYIGVVLDGDTEINTKAVATQAGAALELFGYEGT